VLSKRRTSLEEEMRKIEISIRKLLQADEAITAPVEMVTTRLRKRADREPGELTKDEAHICLLDERRILLTTRQMLQNAIETAQRMHHSLHNTVEEISEDLALKNDTWRIDEACLQSVPGYLLRAPPHPNLDPGPEHPDDRARLDAARELFRRAQKKEKLAASLREQAAVLIARAARDTLNCHEKTEAALALRASELQQLEKQLEEKQKNVDIRLAKHKLEMKRTEWQRAKTEECHKLVKTVEASRRHRKAYENLEDEVSLAVADNIEFLDDNFKEMTYCKEDNTVALRQLERAREIITGDIERKRRTIKLETSARAGGGAQNVPDQSLAIKAVDDYGHDEESTGFWGSSFQPDQEPSPSVSPDVTMKTADEPNARHSLTARANAASPAYDPHAATMREEDLEALRRFNDKKRQQREMKKREEEKRIALYASHRPKEEKLGTKEEQRIEAELEKKRRKEEAVRQRTSISVQQRQSLGTDKLEIPGFPVLCRKVGRGPKGDRKAFASPIYT
jgi:hypothetical protein